MEAYQFIYLSKSNIFVYLLYLSIYVDIKVPWKQDNVERLADMLIAVPEPLGGVLIIGNPIFKAEPAVFKETAE